MFSLEVMVCQLCIIFDYINNHPILCWTPIVHMYSGGSRGVPGVSWNPLFSQLHVVYSNAMAQHSTSAVKSRNQGGYKLRSGRRIKYNRSVTNKQVSPRLGVRFVVKLQCRMHSCEQKWAWLPQIFGLEPPFFNF